MAINEYTTTSFDHIIYYQDRTEITLNLQKYSGMELSIHAYEWNIQVMSHHGRRSWYTYFCNKVENAQQAKAHIKDNSLIITVPRGNRRHPVIIPISYLY